MQLGVRCSHMSVLGRAAQSQGWEKGDRPQASGLYFATFCYGTLRSKNSKFNSSLTDHYKSIFIKVGR